MEKRIRLASVSLVIAGILFVLYPAIRPFSDETSLVGAAAFASPAWIVSHVLAIVAFSLLGAGLLGLYLLLQNGSCGRLALRSIVVTWLGIGLTLPFYGAEVFGLHALGKRALAEQSAEWIALADDIRYGSGFLMILAGLLLIGIGSILVVMVIWKSGALPKWAGALHDGIPDVSSSISGNPAAASGSRGAGSRRVYGHCGRIMEAKGKRKSSGAIGGAFYALNLIRTYLLERT